MCATTPGLPVKEDGVLELEVGVVVELWEGALEEEEEASEDEDEGGRLLDAEPLVGEEADDADVEEAEQLLGAELSVEEQPPDREVLHAEEWLEEAEPELREELLLLLLELSASLVV